MSARDERMVEFRLADASKEKVLMRVSSMLCIFPDRQQVRTIEHGWTVTVCAEDWPKVEKAFRSAYLGMPVHATGASE